MGVEPKIGGKNPQNGWFIMVPNPIKMDDLGVPPEIPTTIKTMDVNITTIAHLRFFNH